MWPYQGALSTMRAGAAFSVARRSNGARVAMVLDASAKPSGRPHPAAAKAAGPPARGPHTIRSKSTAATPRLRLRCRHARERHLDWGHHRARSVPE